MMIFLYSHLYRRDFLRYVAVADVILFGCTIMPMANALLKEYENRYTNAN